MAKAARQWGNMMAWYDQIKVNPTQIQEQQGHPVVASSVPYELCIPFDVNHDHLETLLTLTKIVIVDCGHNAKSDGELRLVCITV